MVLHEFPYNRLAPTLSVVEWLLNLMGTLALKLGGVKAHRGSSALSLSGLSDVTRKWRTVFFAF